MYCFVLTILFACSTDIDVLSEAVLPDPVVEIEESQNIPAENKAPIAVAEANSYSGEAPLAVAFNGSNSSDDHGITEYEWNFPANPSYAANTDFTFNDPGVYDITLKVTDNAGLTDSTTITITVTQQNEEPTACTTNGGFAGDEGLKTWCWNDVSIPDERYFSDRQLFISQHCHKGMVQGVGNRVHFKVNPTTPAPQDCGSSNYNYRAEIRDAPFDVDHPVGTEQWWGFNYKFGEDYIVDAFTSWIFWQIHGSFSSPSSPMVSLRVATEDYQKMGNAPGEIVVANAAVNPDNWDWTPTGIVPQTGQSLDIVIHVVYGDEQTGLYQVWIDGIKVYDEQERTVYAAQPEGGYWKIGIYKSKWKNQSNVHSSASLGIEELNTSIGPLRVMKKSPSSPTYLADEYNTVKPK